MSLEESREDASKPVFTRHEMFFLTNIGIQPRDRDFIPAQVQAFLDEGNGAVDGNRAVLAALIVEQYADLVPVEQLGGLRQVMQAGLESAEYQTYAEVTATLKREVSKHFNLGVEESWWRAGRSDSPFVNAAIGVHVADFADELKDLGHKLGHQGMLSGAYPEVGSKAKGVWYSKRGRQFDPQTQTFK